MHDIQLLTPPYNFAICKMGERAFPGVVVQGDTLSAMLSLLLRMAEALGPEATLDAKESAIVDLGCEIERLTSVMKGYEKVLSENGFSLPYARPWSDHSDRNDR